MKQRVSPGELCAEYLGSMFLVLAAIAPTIFFVYILESSIGLAILANAIAVAFVLMALIEVFGPVSGAHFNPLVSLIMALEKKIQPQKAILFLLMQIAGGISGLVLTHLMFWEEKGVLFSLSENVRRYAYLGEVLGTFILILAILMLLKGRSSHVPMMVAFLVGGQIMATSSTMFANPQVTIARMFTSSTAGIRPLDGLVFIGMQLIGALLAYAVYKLIFAKNKAMLEE